MEEFKIDENDLKKVDELLQTLPSITQKMAKVVDYRKIETPIKTEMRIIRSKTSFPPREKIEQYKQVCETFKFLRDDYNNSISEWNSKMDVLLKKYNYISLKEFLNENPLESIGNNISKSFAFNIKKMADLAGVTILKSLYSGEPKLTNNYPEKFLLLVYKKVDKISDHEL